MRYRGGGPPAGAGSAAASRGTGAGKRGMHLLGLFRNMTSGQHAWRRKIIQGPSPCEEHSLPNSEPTAGHATKSSQR
ncbi:uncharacterized protein LOC114904795 isoform X3 [Monodon monoceros]|nr:uncharacterized protein LOC114904795 isoform X3 [Monodon monoceros]